MAKRKSWHQDDNFTDRITDAHINSTDAVASWLDNYHLPRTKRNSIIKGLTPGGLPAARSPLEELFYVAAAGPCFLRDVTIIHEPKYYSPHLPDFELYRVTPDGDSWIEEYLIVELDGHEFHERTPEQAERDRSRDRWFAAQDLRLVRFTGREIWRDVHTCVAEALEFFPIRDRHQEQ